jgi:hypothetical protein
VVAVAQLVRAPGCGPGGRGFKSLQPPQTKKRPSGVFWKLKSQNPKVKKNTKPIIFKTTQAGRIFYNIYLKFVNIDTFKDKMIL